MAIFAAIGAILSSVWFQVAVAVASVVYQRKRQKKLEKEQDKLKGFDLPVDGEPIHLPLVYGYQSIGGVRTYHNTTSTYYNALPDPALGWEQFSHGARGLWQEDYDPSFTANTTTETIEGGRNAGGIRAFTNERADNDIPGVSVSSKNTFLTTQQALCFAGIDGVLDIEVDGQSYNKGRFNHKIDVNKVGGTAHPSGVYNGVPTTNVFTNVAWCHAAFKLQREDPNYSGVPNITAFVKGQKVHTINANGTLGSKVFSTNSAEVLLDYLLRPKTLGGVGLGGLTADEWLDDQAPDTSRVNLTSFASAKIICGTVVETIANPKGRVNGIADIDHMVKTIAERDALDTETGETVYVTDTDQVFTDGDGWELVPYSERTISLYECNITIDTERSFRDNIELILETMNESDLIYSGGKFKLILDYPSSETEQDAVVAATYDDSFIVSDNVDVSYTGSNERHNRIIVKFKNEELDFKVDSVSWPDFNDANHLKLIAEDGGVISTNEVFLPGCTTRWSALAKAENLLRSSRLYEGDEVGTPGSGISNDQVILSVTLDRRAMVLETGDLFKLSSDYAGISETVFRVETIEYTKELNVKVTASRFSYTSLVYSDKTLPALAPNPSFDASIDDVSNLAYTATARTSAVTASNGWLGWDAPSNTDVKAYHIETSTNQFDWDKLGIVTTKYFDIPADLADGEYRYFRVKVETTQGRFSEGVEIYVQNLSQLGINTDYLVTPIPNGLSIEWTDPTPWLTKEYRVWYSTTNLKVGGADRVVKVPEIIILGLNPNVPYYVWVDKVGYDGFIVEMDTPLVGIPLDTVDWNALDADAEAALKALNETSDEVIDRLAAFDLENTVNRVLEDARIDGDIQEVSNTLSSSINDVVADITTNYVTVASANAAYAQIETDLSASIANVSSDLSTNYLTTVDVNQAISSAQTSLQSQINNVSSNLSTNYYTASTVDSAIAAEVTTLNSTIGDLSANVTSVSSSLDGTRAVNSIHINNNGAVSGYGLISQLDNNGTPTSDFIVDADNFRVGKSSTDGFAAPFQVIGTDTYIKKAFIKDADIGTLKIAGNAVTVPQSETETTDEPGDGTWNTFVNFVPTVLQNGEGGWILATWSAAQGYNGAPIDYDTQCRMLINSTQVQQRGGLQRSDYMTLAIAYYVPPGGNAFVQVDWKGEGSLVTLKNRTLSVFLVKR